MKKRIKLMLLGATLVLYILLINLLGNFSFQAQANNTGDTSYSSGNQVKLNMKDSVGVSIVRNRWYGKIYEEGSSKVLYIINIVRLPIKENGSDYLPIHVIFILIWLLFLLRVLTFNEEFQAAKNNIESSPQEVIEEYRKSLQEPPQGIIEESNKELIEIQETKDLNSLNN